MVVAGLFIGNKISSENFERKSREAIHMFWEMLDEIFNAVLFVLIGLIVHTLSFSGVFLGIAITTIIIVLIARFISVGVPFSLINYKKHTTLKITSLLSWGGLRGGISVALALSLAPDMSRDFIVFITYTIVVFSIIVQGLTIGKLVRFLKLS